MGVAIKKNDPLSGTGSFEDSKNVLELDTSDRLTTF